MSAGTDALRAADADPRSGRRVRARVALLALLAVGWLALLVWSIGLRPILEVMARASWKPLVAAMLAVLAATAVGGYNAWQLSALGERARFGRFLAAYWCGWAIGLVVPGQVGDVVSIAGFFRRWGIPVSQTLARLGLDKAVSLAVALLAVASLPWAVERARFEVPAAGAFAWGALALGLGGAGLLWLASIAKRSERMRRARDALAATLREGRAIVRDAPGRLALNVVLSLVKFAVTGLSYWLVFLALGQDVDYWRVAVVAVAAGMVAYLPISLNGIGTVELAGVFLFGALAIAPAIVASAYLLLRAMGFVGAWLPVAAILPLVLRRAPSAREP